MRHKHADAPEASASSKNRWHHHLKRHLSQMQKKHWLMAATGVVIVAGGIVLALSYTRHTTPDSTTYASAKQPKPLYSKLTGLPIKNGGNKRPVTAVMIENSIPARPQSGLRQAGIVYEAIAEAGITRFMALYQQHQPKHLGPIRSARPYFIKWLEPYGAAYAHVGGSPRALRDIKKWHIKNLDQFFNAGAYHRISARAAPHNMYTSMAALNKLEQHKGWFKAAHFRSFPRKKDQPAKHPSATSIAFNVSRAPYKDYYKYDAKHDAYLRWEGGHAHRDATSKKQLEPKVVIAMTVPYSLESDHYHSIYQTKGSGHAIIFEDGQAIKATWHKAGRSKPLKFTNAKGQAIKLNRGQTWITAVSRSSMIHYHGPPHENSKKQ
jgi:hypothetical protein